LQNEQEIVEKRKRHNIGNVPRKKSKGRGRVINQKNRATCEPLPVQPKERKVFFSPSNQLERGGDKSHLGCGPGTKTRCPEGSKKGQPREATASKGGEHSKIIWGGQPTASEKRNKKAVSIKKKKTKVSQNGGSREKVQKP